MDQCHYKDMVENTLNDKNFYETLDSDPSKAEKLKYTKFLKKHKNCLTKKELEYLEKLEVKSSNFYGLPKVHKSSHINNKCKNANSSYSSYVEISDVNDLKLRPIVAGPSCQTHRLSDIIDILLKPYTKHVNCYLRDTINFLNTLPLTVKEETLIASFDVESLHTNIPHELGIEAINYWLDRYPQEIQNRLSKEFILEGIELILKNNSFYFDGTFYRQIKGTAMGTKFAPTYATLSIAYLEVKLYERLNTEFGEEFTSYFKQYWKRFQDDCFIPWTRSETDLDKLHFILNSLHSDIKFTKEYSNKEQAFLDVLVKK